MRKPGIVTAVLLVAALVLFCGCDESKKTVFLGPANTNTAPQVAAVPDQAAVVNMVFSVDLTPYVTDAEDDIGSLTFYVVSGGGSFTGATYQNTFAAAGTVTVNFVVTDTGGMFALGSFDVIISAGTKPLVADFSADVTYGPAPLDVTFTNMSSGSVSAWSWTVGDGGTSTEQSPSYQYTTPGIYTVSLTVTGTGGSDSITKTSYIQVLGGSSGIIHVDGASTAATPDGSSWALAFPLIQSGIDATTDYDMVLVADGTYTGATNTNLDFGGKAISVRAYDLYGSGVTTIDCEGVPDGNGFYFQNGETNEAVVDGFTIINGFREGGSGIECQASSPTIRNCTFMYASGGADGGGIGAYGNSHPVIENCTIKYNQADNGAGICVYSNSSATIINCTISDNSATNWAGGVWVNYSSEATIINSVIRGNYAGNAAGGICGNNTSTITVEGCEISGNSAVNGGGGIFALQGTTLTVTDSTISGNTAGTAGGGITFYDGTASLTDSVITGNFSASFGGGIHCEEDLGPTPDLVLTRCSVTGNMAAEGGGGIYSLIVNATATDCFVSNNSVASIGNPAQGGGIAMLDTNWMLTGCTISGNSANSINNQAYGGGIYVPAKTSGALEMTDCTVSGNTLQGYQYAHGGGIYMMGGISPTLTDCTVSQNTARLFYSDTSNSYGAGGGLYYFSSTDSLALTRVTVSGNSLLCNVQGDSGNYFGAGIYVQGDATITDCVITGNELSVTWNLSGTPPLGGAGIAAGDLTTKAGNIQITGCTVRGNEINAATGAGNDSFGAGVFFRGDVLTIQNSTVSDNSLSSNDYCYGGGVYAEGGLLTFEDSTVSDNSADGFNWGVGGGICSRYDRATVTGCAISGNSLNVKGTSVQAKGGGLSSWSCPATSQIDFIDSVIDGNSVLGDLNSNYGGGGVHATSTFAKFVNCAITGNVSSGDGGGVLLVSIESDMDFCTLSNNSAGRYGGAVAADWLDLIAWDVILWSNTAATSGNEIYVPSGPVNLHYAVVPSAAQDPDRFSGAGITEYGDCVNADPMFVTGPLGSFYLDPSSPAVDAGSNTAVIREVDDKTTRTDGTLDTGTADIGYHYKP